MASVIGLPVRWSRLKINHFKQLTRNFQSNSTIKRKLNSGQTYWWYLLGGSVCAGAIFKWQQMNTVVTAFNPKKIKVSGAMCFNHLFLNCVIQGHARIQL